MTSVARTVRKDGGIIQHWREVLRRFSGRGVYPHELAFLLTIPLRSFVQFSPAELCRRLELAENARVLELGSGPGFFSAEVARRVSRGRLELCDLQAPMLHRARQRLARTGLRNVGFSCADAGRLPYRSDTFDAAYLITVLGEVGDARQCLGELSRVLRPGGMLSISETRSDPDFFSVEDVQAMAAEADFKPARTFGPARNYTANFTKA